MKVARTMIKELLQYGVAVMPQVLTYNSEVQLNSCLYFQMKAKGSKKRRDEV